MTSPTPSSSTHPTPNNPPQSSQRNPPFPAHTQPRVWFLTSGTTPIAITLARQLLRHGDSVVVGFVPAELESADKRKDEFRALCIEAREREGWGERFKIIECDIRSVGQCQSAVAEAVEKFGRIDILFCCNSEGMVSPRDRGQYHRQLIKAPALIGTIEELGQTTRTQSLVTDQFATNFFGPVNIIKAVLPTLRGQKNGHVILLTGITGHLGTPGLGMYCASQWAIEGYCDSLAYEIAPFNLKLSIVQSNIEVSILTNKLLVVPPMSAYQPPANSAPLSRFIFGRMLDRLSEVNDSEVEEEEVKPSAVLTSPKTTELYPSLPAPFTNGLIAETIYAILAIGGHENPPARHIVGFEGVASVKEKLRTVSEELEDFVEVSGAVDFRETL